MCNYESVSAALSIHGNFHFFFLYTVLYGTPKSLTICARDNDGTQVFHKVRIETSAHTYNLIINVLY